MSEPRPPQPGPAAGPDPAVASGAAPDVQAPVQVRLRRAPRYRVFVLTGALVGIVVAVVGSLLLGPDGSSFSFRTLTLYLATIGALVGGLLGGAVAVLLDRPRR